MPKPQMTPMNLSGFDVTHVVGAGCTPDGQSVTVTLEINGEDRTFILPHHLGDMLAGAIDRANSEAFKLRHKDGMRISPNQFQAQGVDITPSKDLRLVHADFIDKDGLTKSLVVPMELALKFATVINGLPLKPRTLLPGLPTKPSRH